MSVNETTSENAVAKTTVSPNSRMNCPTIPLMNAIGANTATSTSVIANAAPPSSLRPATAASSPRSPRRALSAIASTMTIESSTRMPIVRERAISDSTLMLNLIAHIAQSAASSEAGIEIAAMRALRQARRNASMTATVSTMPSPIVCRTPLMAERVNGASLRNGVKRTNGYSRASRANVFAAAAIAASESAPAARLTDSTMPRVPSTVTITPGSSMPSRTVATSPTRSAVTAGMESGSARRDSAVSAADFTPRVVSRCDDRSRPPGKMSLADATARATSSGVPPASASAPALGTTVSCARVSPAISTVPMPVVARRAGAMRVSTACVSSRVDKTADVTASSRIGACDGSRAITTGGTRSGGMLGRAASTACCTSVRSVPGLLPKRKRT